MSNRSNPDKRITQYIQAAEHLKKGRFDLQLPLPSPEDELGKLGRALIELAHSLERRYREVQKLDEITAHINAGLLLDEVLESVYQNFREIIPYNRIGCSLLENDGQMVRAVWAKTDQPEVKLTVGYEAELAGSSLEQILNTGQPRILNNLEAYLQQKPSSESTRLIMEEGIRSSLTCPLIANGIPVGFMFFSSTAPHTYDAMHVRSYMRIAGQLSIIVEKGRLVSELAEQKAAIEAKNAELVRLNATKNEFLGIAAHDLRNPIAYIKMIGEFMRDPAIQLTKEERATMLADIVNQSDHMLMLLNELLDVTKIESGKLQLHSIPINVADFLTDAVQRHNKLAASKGTIIQLSPVPEGAVSGDKTRLRQVVDNLLSNAVKYSPAGSTIQVVAEKSAQSWRISVSDEGPGIKPDERQKLFKDFSRLSARPTGGESSIGLGLAITRRVVEAHGGEIDVDSSPGNGATFWFTLPA